MGGWVGGCQRRVLQEGRKTISRGRSLEGCVEVDYIKGRDVTGGIFAISQRGISEEVVCITGV